MSKLYNNLEIHIENLEDSHIQKYEPNTPYSFKESGHYYFFYVRHGQIQIVSDKREFQVSEHQCLITKCKDIIHLFVSFSQADVLVFHFKETHDNLEFVRDTVSDIKGRLATLLSAVEYRLNIIHTIKTSKPSILYDKEIGNYFNVNTSLLYSFFDSFLLFLTESKIADTLPDKILDSYLSNLNQSMPEYHTLSDNQPRTHRKHIYKNELVNQVINYMSANLQTNLTINEIAEEFLVSPANLKRIFKSETGHSIIHYFHILKIDTAQTLIIKNEKSYTEIASMLGFNSIHHFSTAFKKHTGYPPSKFYQMTVLK